MLKNNKKNIKILVACHKPDMAIRNDCVYMPIHVGKALHPEVNLGFQGDDEGDNISDKNGRYCELTALYWAWKNLKNVDYIGLCHYRRYFDYKITDTNLIKDLNKYDAIAIKRRCMRVSASGDLTYLLCLEDVALMMDTLLTLYPEYKESARKYYYKNNKVSQCNMFIMKWSDFDRYCNFLFPLLKAIDELHPNHSFTRLNRNLGYMAESLQGLYFFHNRFKIKYVEKDDPTIRKRFIIDFFRNLRNKIVFRMNSLDAGFYVYESVRTGLKQDGIELKNI